MVAWGVIVEVFLPGFKHGDRRPWSVPFVSEEGQVGVGTGWGGEKTGGNYRLGRGGRRGKGEGEPISMVREPDHKMRAPCRSSATPPRLFLGAMGGGFR